MKVKDVGLVAAFSSVYAAVSLLPGFPVMGLPGADIKIARSLEPIYGIVLGPFLGPLSAFIGAIAGRMAMGGGMGVLFSPLALISSFIAGYTAWRKDWKVPTIAFSMIIVLWYSTVGAQIPYYAVPHLAGLLILPLFGRTICKFLISEKKREMFVGLALISYSSTMAGHMSGNLLFFILVNPPPTLFLTTLPLTMIERSLITAISAILGVPVIIAIRRYLSTR